MKTICIELIILAFVIISVFANDQKNNKKDYPIKPVPFTKVKVDDNFWAPRIKINSEVTIPLAFRKAEETGRIDNFRIAAGIKKGKFASIYPFDDSDVFKNIEAAAYSLQTFPDPALDQYLDTLIDLIGKAQEKDGYLYTNRTIDPEHAHEWAGKKRWENEEKLSHELYNIGHLYEAAAAHFLATKKRTLLDIALKSADLVDKEFGWGKIEKVPGHQVIEMGLVKLYRITGNEKYLSLAKFFIDKRGLGSDPYCQNHKKFIDQDEAVGHAVRAEYLYSGAADVAALTGEKSYINALDKIWEDVVYKKLYITGGTGSEGGWEGFGPPYALPNLTAYCETCAAIANVFWNLRMFLLHGESKYFDVLERTLYNGLISGVSLSGDRFFYPNPLASLGQHSRSEWFGCACCPVNITRLIPSIPGYIYATKDSSVYINLFMQNSSEIELKNKMIKIRQETKYPWDGNILFEVSPEDNLDFSIMIRIPGWASNQPIPGDLYKFYDKNDESVSIKINGKELKFELLDGYAVIKREWKKGDKIELNLPMPVRKILANDKVKDDKDRIALQRGPLLYCTEWSDYRDRRVHHIYINANSEFSTEFRKDILYGIEVIKGQCDGLFVTENIQDGENIIEKTESRKLNFMAIPYFSWANRGAGEMMVWIPIKSSEVKPFPLTTIASKSTISASHITKLLKSINDLYEPKTSNDRSIPYYHWWPTKNTTEWIQYDFGKDEEIFSSSVFWFDDAPEGGCRLPESWRILYKKGNEWLPVKNIIPYPVVKDKFNFVKFEKVKTNSVRIEVKLKEKFSAGIYEWMVR